LLISKRAPQLTPLVKAGLEQLAQEWLALADQAELLEKRYGPLVAADLPQARPQPVFSSARAGAAATGRRELSGLGSE
jgi:hypothetical protein